MISGEYDLMDMEEALEQNIWPRSAPHFNAEMEE